MTGSGSGSGGIRVDEFPVARTARIALLGDDTADEFWLVLHGYGQLAERFLRSFLPAASPGRLIVAPEALSRFYTSREPSRVGATWMTREARESEITDYLAYLDAVVARYGRSASRITVHGFSQGTATATRWAWHTTRVVDRLVLWGGEVAKEVDLRGLRARQPTMQWDLCVGRQDQFVSEAAVSGETGRLDAAEVPYTLHWFDGGHEVDAETLAGLDDR